MLPLGFLFAKVRGWLHLGVGGGGVRRLYGEKFVDVWFGIKIYSCSASLS